MRCEEVMVRELPRCSGRASARMAAVLLRNSDARVVLVISSEGTLRGVITATDLVDKVLAAGDDGSILAEQAMTSLPLLTCEPDDDVEAAREKMCIAGRSSILIVDGNGVCRGVVSQADLRHFAEQRPSRS